MRSFRKNVQEKGRKNIYRQHVFLLIGFIMYVTSSARKELQIPTDVIKNIRVKSSQKRDLRQLLL